MSGFRTPEIPRAQLVPWERRLEDAVPEEHQVRHLDVLLGSAAFAETFREMEQRYVLNRSKPSFNTQVGVDDARGAIVAADVNDEPDDSGQLTPMVEQVIENCGGKPQSVSHRAAHREDHHPGWITSAFGTGRA